MKFNKVNTGKGILIPNAALRLSGLDEGTLELRTECSAAILFKHRMTAAELLQTVDALSRTASDLILRLTAACGECDGCDPECLFQDDEWDDIPAEQAEMLAECGVCFGALRDLMDREAVVYGG